MADFGSLVPAPDAEQQEFERLLAAVNLANVPNPMMDMRRRGDMPAGEGPRPMLPPDHPARRGAAVGHVVEATPLQELDWGDIGRSARTGARTATQFFLTVPERLTSYGSEAALHGAGALGEFAQKHVPQSWTGTHEALANLPGAIETMRGLSEPHRYPSFWDIQNENPEQFGERTEQATLNRMLGPAYEPQTKGGEWAKEKAGHLTGVALAGPLVLGHLGMRYKPDNHPVVQKEKDYENMRHYVEALARRDYNSHAAAVKAGEQELARMTEAASKGTKFLPEELEMAAMRLKFLKERVKPWGP